MEGDCKRFRGRDYFIALILEPCRFYIFYRVTKEAKLNELKWLNHAENY